MSTTLLPSVLDTYTLIYVEVDKNSNKVWRGSLRDDGTFVAESGAELAIACRTNITVWVLLP